MKRRQNIGRKKKLLFSLILLVFLLAVFELFSYVGLRSMGPDSPYLRADDWDEYVAEIDDSWLEAYFHGKNNPLMGWHKELGWNNREGGVRVNAVDKHETVDQRGARTNTLFPDERPVITTFGDSFTFCDCVGDDETWQYYLSEQLGFYVANYGVGGFGPDQALLKYRMPHEGRDSADVAILGIHEGDLTRALMRFWPFNGRDSGLKLGFKPRFIIQNGELEYLPQALEAPTLNRSKIVDAIENSTDHDTVYARRTPVEFPFSFRMGRVAMIGSMDALNLAGFETSMDPVYPKPFWRDRYPINLLRLLVEEFVSTAEQRGAGAIVLFIPAVPGSWGTNGDRSTSYERVIPQFREWFPSDRARIVDIAEADFESSRFMNRGPCGHASPYGNQVISDHLRGAIDELLNR